MSRHNFKSIAPASDASATPQIGLLRFAVSTLSGKAEMDFTALRGTRLERDIVLAFSKALEGLRVTAGQANRTNRDLLGFLKDLAERHPDVVGTDDLTASILDDWVLRTMPQGPASGWSAYDRCMDVFRVLKELSEHALNGPVKERLAFIHPQGSPTRTPRDSYSSHVVDQLVAACRERIPKIVARLTVEAERLIFSGTDPRGRDIDAWCQQVNQAWLANEIGPLPSTYLPQVMSTSLRERRAESLTSTNTRLFPTPLDLTPFFILIALETGWTPAEIMEVHVDCQSNITRDHVTLTTTKYRAGHKRHSERFRANGYFSAGGLVAKVIAITERLRRFTQLPFLFVAASGSRVHQVRFRAQVREALGAFCAEIGLTDDDGTLLTTLKPARLRKSHKERWYKSTNGQIDRFAREDHSRAVAAVNYGNIPALAETHDSTIEDAQRAAMQAVLKPRVAVSTIPERIAEEAGLQVSDARDLATGARDMWVSGCLDLHTSPFGKKGETCKSRPGMCLECNNAVVLGRHLPRILAYRTWLENQRESMGDAEWNHLHGMGYLNIQRVILPRFPAAIIARAHEIASADYGVPILPPAIIMDGVV
jgi:hypothetical protein